ncbi:restriction endonuclease subunit S [Staphylococcus epidermidis]|uniref:restriction endonuclease subunit S n=2 Tax=Staphylococcus epidermidis TaxID=1282 RepID=UPI00193C3EA5|nr:restriction endonuclease subunit S [Staphylococcus epidermidis]MBM6264669.1 restriction endonuclease subunit S [Staphylococcus epidermidis]MCG8951212.1 restriction endonuclease subunit S [Staphylococcus epidermidis]MCH9547052.1 restriction endonuclease subunit S [Staphylococcus epidermidis]MCH9567904.1 restriction endonuclease subunit S [Staphylococcus epidermidis]QRJ33420.1 restriction endonuclease subunit S [Staphylococcus epidermidis]
MTEHTNTPALRFPEFRDEWNQNKLSDVVNVYDGTHQTPKYTNEGIKFLSVENIKTLNSNKYISKEDFIKEFKIHPEYGDILMTRIGDIGTPNIVNLKEPLAYYVSLALLKPININSYFLNSLILSPTVQNELWRKTLHIAFPKKINKNEIAKVLINYPTFNEQEKIGYFFSKLDHQIELEEKKLELLEQQKKGYMQKIFSQQLRFKDENGNDYPNWAVVKLKDILSERKEYASKTENYPHATLSTSGITLKSDRYNRDFLVKDKSKKYKVTIMNDICYNPANLKFGVITRNRIGSVIFSPIYITFEVNNGYSPLFIELLVTRNDFINRIRKYEEGTVYERMAVKPKDFLNYETEIPCLEEQKKIGDFLVKIDKLIENQSKKIDFLKQRKQGLLQKMFV